MLLAINTATPVLSLALVEDGQLLAEARRDVGNEHSEAIFVLLETLFAWCGRPKSDLKAVAVAVGPGGFTGVRTGISVARTIAQVRDLPIYGVGTLDALASQFPGPALVSAMLDARRNLVFAGLFRVGAGTLETVVAPALHPIAEWEATLCDRPEPLILVGEGAMRHRDQLGKRLPQAWIPSDALMAASALTIGLIAEQRLAAGCPTEQATLEPVYLREPQAVVNWEAAQQAKEAQDGRPHHS